MKQDALIVQQNPLRTPEGLSTSVPPNIQSHKHVLKCCTGDVVAVMSLLIANARNNKKPNQAQENCYKTQLSLKSLFMNLHLHLFNKHCH